MSVKRRDEESLEKSWRRSSAKLVTSEARSQLVARGCRSLRLAHWKAKGYLGLN